MSARAGNSLLDADASEQLGEINGRLDRLDAELQSKISEANSKVVSGAWEEELAKPAASAMQRGVLLSGGAIASVSGIGVAVSTGFGSVPLSGGLVPADSAAAFEFGANRDAVRTYTAHSRKGLAYQVTRHTARQMPAVSRSGWLAYPAARRLGKRIAELLQATVVKFTSDAIDGGK